MRTAKQSDWKTNPLPAKNTVILLDRHFTSEETAIIRRGVIPEEMEDKWFIYWSDDTLFFHRSWTGCCVYVVNFETEVDGSRMVRALANRDPEQCQETNDEKDALMISFLINVVVLHRLLEFPSSEPSAANRPLTEWSQVGRAALGEHPKND